MQYRLVESPRRGTATVELAVLLIPMLFLYIIAVDYSRIFYYSLSIQNAAYAGAYYGSLGTANSTNTTAISNAALADAPSMSATCTVSSKTGTDVNSNATISVTVSGTFNSVMNWSGVPGAPASSTAISRTVILRVQ